MGFEATQSHEKYLGLPSLIGRQKKKTFESVNAKILQKLQLWKEKLFSVWGNEVLIKAVAMTIPTYAISIFYFPTSLCEDIQNMITR